MNTRSKRAQRSLLPTQSPPSEFSLISTDSSLAGITNLFPTDLHSSVSHDSEETVLLPLDSSVISKPKEPLAALDPDFTSQIKSIADKAKEHDMDPNKFMMHQLLCAHTLSVQPHSDTHDTNPDMLSKVIGKLSDQEDVFVFLHRFEIELSTRHISLGTFHSYIPTCLLGRYKEAYYNNVSHCTSYDDMKLVLLNAVGYSITECLNSYPLKFRTGGTKSVIQWYNNWKYKFEVILGSLPFLLNFSDAVVSDMANLFATVGILAGMSCASNSTLVHECNSWFLSSSVSHSKFVPNNFHFNAHQEPSVIDSWHVYKRPHYHNQYRSALLPSPTINQHQPHYGPNRPQRYSIPVQSSPPRCDISTVTCYKCNQLCHYANICPTHSTTTQSQQSYMQPSHDTVQQHNNHLNLFPSLGTHLGRYV